MDDPVKVALIYGSTREGRFCDTVANWAADEIRGRNDFALELIDPAGRAHGGKAATEAIRQRLDEADAFIVVTPEYNHGYPAPLKFLIDSAYDEWQAKPVAFVSYGGISGGLRAVEQLRLVFAELHAMTLRDSVSFANARTRFGADGSLVDPEQARRSMATMLTRLRWWAMVLREGRNAAPYAAAAA